MTQEKIGKLVLPALLAGALSLAGCAKKAAQVTPPAPPAPAPAAPTATLAANPTVIQPGQASTLTWQTRNANEITIAGLGTLPASGTRTVTPGTSVTYTLVAKGPGGANDASARITVNTPVASSTQPSDEDLFARNVKDIYFDYDRANLRSDDAPIVQNDEAFLVQHSSIKVLVEGHCDDRGSEEYNIALGASRAESAKQALIQQGVSAERIRTVSYGKEKPFCTQDNEQCWQQNRVDHFAFDR
ncbi:MAG TPA: peptidoglycan-associated lipoprotein Pal [Terriglobales bacterium]|jgi:peptidoglycan-associated lipoprotein|nr:peptidoglycan-associated lipoprotein Pal [Terriglobales bacterium]